MYRTFRLAIPVVYCLMQASPIKAQNSIKSYTEELNIVFDQTDLKKIEKAIGLLNQADAIVENSKDMYNQLTVIEKKERITDEYQKALKTLMEASEIYKEAHGSIFSVFKDKSTHFWKSQSKVSHYASGMDKARYYEQEALKNTNRGLIRREQVLESDRFEYALLIMNDALHLEKLSIRDQGRALQICTDYPVEYNYGWEDDKTLAEVVAIMRDPAINEPPADIFATVDKEAKVDSFLLREIIFKVQIAAHTMPLTEEYLKSLYQGDLPIDMVFEDEWYKYSIGRYLTFDDAEATRRECNIKKAFVVAYEKGIHISTQEALKILEERQFAP